MYVHPQAKIGYYAHMRTGSTSTRMWLEKRGFIKVSGHHQPPWGWRRNSADHPERDFNSRWWWNERQWEYQFYATVRNHFDIMLSFKHWMNWEGPITAGKIDQYTFTRYNHLYCHGIIFAAFQLIPNCRPLYYENLQFDLNRMLETGGLPPITDDEARKHANYTDGKPTDDWRNHIDADERNVIEQRFAWEMGQYGYSWEGVDTSSAKVLRW